MKKILQTRDLESFDDLESFKTFKLELGEKAMQHKVVHPGLYLKAHIKLAVAVTNILIRNRTASRENQHSAYAKTKVQISFAVTAKLISAFVFATRLVQFLDTF